MCACGCFIPWAIAVCCFVVPAASTGSNCRFGTKCFSHYSFAPRKKDAQGLKDPEGIDSSFLLNNVSWLMFMAGLLGGVAEESGQFTMEEMIDKVPPSPEDMEKTKAKEGSLMGAGVRVVAICL